MSFELSFEPLSTARPEWGRVARLPWDEAIFGFPVGTCQLGEAAELSSAVAEIRAALRAWACAREAELVSLEVDADDAAGLGLAGALGGAFVDQSVYTTSPALRPLRLPRIQLSVRPGKPGDGPALGEIAATAFRFGRYHQDARFPPALAAERYRVWVQRALAEPTAGTRVYVAEGRGELLGFFHAEIADRVADLRLAGVTRQEQGGLLGVGLFASVLAALREEGVRKAKAKISAANVGVANIYASLGFRFSRPRATFHWHSPKARHLIGLEQLVA